MDEKTMGGKSFPYVVKDGENPELEEIKARLTYWKSMFDDDNRGKYLRFYNIAGSKMDHEKKKEVEDIDMLTHATRKGDFNRVHAFLFIVSVVLFLLSGFAHHEDFTIDMVEGIRFAKHNWEPVLCKFDDSEGSYRIALIPLMFYHAFVFLWSILPCF